MIQSTFHTKQYSCADLFPLIEQQLLRESLTTSEECVLHDHVCQCGQCTDFITFTKGLSSFAPPASEQAFQYALDDATDEFFESKTKQKKWIGAAIAASIAAMVLVSIAVTYFKAVEPKVPVVVNCDSSTPTEVLSGVWMSHCIHQPPKVKIHNGNDLDIFLPEGIVGISANPNRLHKGKISVRTVHGEVLVRGTIFTVHKELNDSRVEVFRGKVAVRPGVRQSDEFRVVQGNGAWLNSRDQYSLPGRQANSLRRNLVAVLYPAPTDSNPVLKEGQQNSVEISAGTASAKERRVEPASLKSPKSKNGGEQVPSLDSLLHSARNCLIDQDWQCAAEKYRTMLKQYGNRWESMPAYISLAKIELRHLNSPTKARIHFSAYQKRYPQGPLIEEAIFGKAACERQLGNRRKELKILRSFIRNYADSSLAIKARKRIAELESQTSNP